MNIKKQFEDITIQVFEEKYRTDILNFELSERQQIYSSLPKTVLEEALNDDNRVANIAKGMIRLKMSFMYDHCQLMNDTKDMVMVLK